MKNEDRGEVRSDVLRAGSGFGRHGVFSLSSLKSGVVAGQHTEKYADPVLLNC